MKTENRYGAIAIAWALMSASALAQTSPERSQACDGQALMAHFEKLAEADLKAQYLLCARVASQRRLSQGEAAGCSIAAEVLKARSFGGDFDALIAWWRLHRDEPVAGKPGGGGGV